MNSKKTNMLAYATVHPIKTVVLSVFTLFTILGSGYGVLAVVAPDIVEAVSIGGSCCGGTWGGGGWYPSPAPPEDNWGGGGGGGGGGGVYPGCILTATPPSITSGGSSTLTWSSHDSDTAVLSTVGTVATAGTRTVSPTETTLYRLTVTRTSSGRAAACTATVTVTPPVVVPVPSCTLSIDPSVIELGSSADIAWTTTNGSTFSINNGIGASTPTSAGTKSITPATLGTKTYTGTVTSATGATATCSDTVTVIPPIVVNAPSCTLNIAPESITLGESATITWGTRYADTFGINNGVGPITIFTTPIGGGTKSITPTTAGVHTYTGTIINTDGKTATCSDTVTVLPVVIGTTPACTLTTDGLGKDDTTTKIHWTITDATGAVLNGKAITPANGSKTVKAGAYSLTVSDDDGDEATCAIIIEPWKTFPAPACTLTTTGIPVGETMAPITWTIKDAISATLNTVTIPTTDGSDSVEAGEYSLLVTGAGGDTKTCNLIIEPPLTGFSCTLNIDKSSMRSGESATMTWATSGAASFTINAGARALSGSETLTPLGIQTYTYTGVATNTAGETVECSDTIQVTGGSGGGGLACSMTFSKSSIRSGESSELRWTTRSADSAEINSGVGVVALNGDTSITQTGVGSYEYVLTARKESDTAICRATLQVTGGSGGCTSNCGGGSTSPNITIDFLKGPGLQPLAFVTLSQIPYTGLELGEFGTIVYWLFLIVWSGAVAYIVLFKALPYTGRKLALIGTGVSEAINATEEGTMSVHMQDDFEDVKETHFSPKTGDEPLSVEDIVRGLSRMHQAPRPVMHSASPVEVEEEEAEMPEADVAQEMEMPPVQAQPTSVEGEELRLLNALMSGDRDTTFSILRRSTRGGARPEALIEKVLVFLDSAYRERVEGSACTNDVRRMCASVDTGILEEVISSLASAIDTTYSQSQTGAKLALARAHAVIERA